MKTIGKITTFIVMLALITATAINLTIHIKSGEVQKLFKPGTQQEQPAPEVPTQE